MFATVRSSTAVDGPATSYGLTGHAVSPFVSVVFSNLVTRISFSQPLFRPALGQTQQVSAVFAANVNWTLQITDINSNEVRTATGSGASMLFNWDGTGTGETNIPDGIYYYYISAQTNGQLLSLGFDGGGNSMASGASVDTTEWLAVPTDGPGSVVPLALYPPGADTSDLTIFQGSMSDYLPQFQPHAAGQSFAMDSGTGGASPDYSGASYQAAAATPQRPPPTPSKGSAGTIAVAYQLYNANGTNPVYAAPILDNKTGLLTYVQMANNYGTTSLPYAPFRNVDLLAINFISEMQRGSWDLGDVSHLNNSLSLSDLRGSGSFFNNYNLGLLLVHGTYGTSFDSTPGRQVKQMYFPIASGGGAQYLRMSEMSLGGPSPTNGLKWIAIMACTSLYQQNWNSMKNQQVTPYNSNLHMILGCATDFGAEPLIGQLWADYMLGLGTNIFTGQPNHPMKIRDAWYQAANDAYKQMSSLVVVPNPTVMAVVADSNCTEDYLETNSAPAGGIWSYYNSKQVYPPFQ